LQFRINCFRKALRPPYYSTSKQSFFLGLIHLSPFPYSHNQWGRPFPDPMFPSFFSLCFKMFFPFPFDVWRLGPLFSFPPTLPGSPALLSYHRQQYAATLFLSFANGFSHQLSSPRPAITPAPPSRFRCRRSPLVPTANEVFPPPLLLQFPPPPPNFGRPLLPPFPPLFLTQALFFTCSGRSRSHNYYLTTLKVFYSQPSPQI